MKLFKTFLPVLICIGLFGCNPPAASTEAKPDGTAVTPENAQEAQAGGGGAQIILPGGGAATPVAPDPNLGGGTGGGAAQAAKNMARNAADKATGSAAPAVPEETN